MHQVNDLYALEPKVDAWKAQSWVSNSVHRSDEEIITNLYILGSDDHTQNNGNKLSKELYEDNKICL